jgi:hypothetical protein
MLVAAGPPARATAQTVDFQVVDIRTLQQWLRHADITTTARYLRSADLSDAGEKLAAFNETAPQSPRSTLRTILPNT